MRFRNAARNCPAASLRSYPTTLSSAYTRSSPVDTLTRPCVRHARGSCAFLHRPTSSLRESSGQKPGGQKGCKGTPIRQAEQPDEAEPHVGDFALPSTNNTAERAVRMPKVKQKISGCFRTLDGAEHFCVIRSCLDTLRKQGHNMLAVLQRAFARTPIPSVA